MLSCSVQVTMAQEVRMIQFSGDTWQTSKQNAAYVEFLGGTSLYSLNFQRITRSSTQLAFTYRLGASYLPGYTTLTSYLGGILGRPKRAFELLVGLGYYGIRDAQPSRVNFDEQTNRNYYFSPQVGYRNQNPKTGLLFRATATPYFYILKGQGLGPLRHTPGFGLSVGKVF